MASVYILFSKQLNKYYTGSCLDLKKRIEEHKTGYYINSYTAHATDWELFLSIDKLDESSARNIEKHVKSMKSKKYIENLKQYPELKETLVSMYLSK